MRIQILFAILFLSQVTFSGVDRNLSNLLKNLQDPDLHLDDKHRGAEHDDDKGNHWYDIILELNVPEGSNCDDLYTSTCQELIDLGCADPCDEPNSIFNSDVTWYSINDKMCMIALSFTAEEAGAIEQFYKECDNCVAMSFDEVVTYAEETTWGVKKMADYMHTISDPFIKYNLERDNNAGSGTRIYVIDTGFDDFWRNRPEFEDENGESRVLPGKNYVHDGSGNTVVTDHNGHGTHVIGTAGAHTYGVATGATIIPIRHRSLHETIQGLKWARDDCNGRKCVITCSWYYHGSSVLDDVVNSLGTLAVPIPVVVAACNEGRDLDDLDYSPQRADWSIVVGSMDHNMRRSPFSNYGPSIDVWAPGSHVLSTHLNGKFKYLWGTSMAAPHVSGLIAIMMSNNDATSQRNSIMSQLHDDYGVTNVLSDVSNRNSVNVFGQLKLPKWTMVQYGGCWDGSWKKIGYAFNLEDAKALMLADDECSKDGSLLFYSRYSYDYWWGVRCAGPDKYGGCIAIEDNDNNPNWETYGLNLVCPDEKIVVVDHIDHVWQGTNGRYFYFSKDDWTTMAGSWNNGQIFYIDQFRDGQRISQNKRVIIWENGNGVHGRYDPYGSAINGDWQAGDIIALTGTC